MYDSAAAHSIPKAVFNNGLTTYAVDARYLLREWKNGDKTEIIYEVNEPANAVVYTFWGYWFRWGELAVSVILLVVLFQVAVAITKNPTPEALMDQLEVKQEKKRRYKE